MLTAIILQEAAGTSIITTIIYIAVASILYFAPSIIGRNNRNFTSLMLLNLFAGWTGIGWLVLLIWAVQSDDEGPIHISPNQKPAISIAEQLEKLAALHEKDMLTDDEFMKEKSRLLVNK